MKSLNWFGTQVNRSSLGLHMIAPYLYPEYESSIIAAKPAIMKIVGDNQEFAMFSNYYNALKDISIFVGRPYTPCELVTQGLSYGVPVETIAQDWKNAVLSLVQYMPNAYWELCNEPSRAFTPVLAQLVVRCIELAAANGFKIVAPCWSVGVPGMARWGDYDDWEDFLPALEAINSYGPGTALLGVHEYAGWPGTFLNQPWRVGRINGVYEDYINPHGWSNIYTVNLEDGRDDPPWQNIPLSAETYGAELADDAVQDMYDAHVVGRTIYTLDSHPSWTKFNIYGACANMVINYIASRQPATYPPMPQPGTPPPPPPPPGGQKSVWAGGLYLRTGPGSGYQPITIMPYGTVVNVLESSNGWAHVTVTRGFWQLATSTSYSTFTGWQQQNETLEGWCSEYYLE